MEASARNYEQHRQFKNAILHREIVLTMKPDFTLRAYLMIKITSIAR